MNSDHIQGNSAWTQRYAVIVGLAGTLMMAALRCCPVPQGAQPEDSGASPGE